MPSSELEVEVEEEEEACRRSTVESFYTNDQSIDRCAGLALPYKGEFLITENSCSPSRRWLSLSIVTRDR